MILHNTTFNLDTATEKEWLGWIKEVYLNQALLSGLILEHRILKMLSTIYELDGVTYSIQFHFNHVDDVAIFEEKHLPSLNAQLNKKFDGKYASFSTQLEEVEL